MQPAEMLTYKDAMTQTSTTNISEEILTQRFMKLHVEHAMKEQTSIEFTRDPALLHQYYILRQEMYTKVWNLKNFSGLKDEFDTHSHTLVIRNGKQVVGGARLIISSPRKPQPLPLEAHGIPLNKLLPNMNRHQDKIAEISRFALDPSVSRSGCTRRACTALNRKALALGIKYVFILAPEPLRKMYEKHSKTLGHRHTSVEEEFPAYDASGITLRLSIWELDEQSSQDGPDHTPDTIKHSVSTPSPEEEFVY